MVECDLGCRVGMSSILQGQASLGQLVHPEKRELGFELVVSCVFSREDEVGRIDSCFLRTKQ